MASDLYVVLGVSADAPPEEIKSAYRKLANRFHPDRYGPDERLFRQVQQAYVTLSDPEQRRAYDRSIRARRVNRPAAEPLRPRAFAEPLAPHRREVSMTDFEAYHPSFDELFERLWSNFSLLTRPKAERLEPLVIDVPLAPEEARTGGQASIRIPARARCPTCRGRGAVGRYQCWRCMGQGALTADYPLDVSYPAGLRHDYVVQVPLSEFGIDNFYLVVRFRPSEQME